MKTAMRMACATLVLALLTAGSASAHHAMEYIEMESYTTARQGELVFHLHYDHMADTSSRLRSLMAIRCDTRPGLSRRSFRQ